MLALLPVVAVRCRCGAVLEERRAKARAGGREAERAGGRAAREGVRILTPKNRGAAEIGGKEPGGPAARRIRLAGVHARDSTPGSRPSSTRLDNLFEPWSVLVR